MPATLDLIEGVWSDAIATGKILDPATCFIGIGTALTDLGVNTLLSDITLATGSLAPTQVVTAWHGPYQLLDGSVYYESQAIIFSPSSSSDAANIVVWYIGDADPATILKYYGQVNPAIDLTGPTSALTLIARLVITTAGITDVSVIVNG